LRHSSFNGRFLVLTTVIVAVVWSIFTAPVYFLYKNYENTIVSQAGNEAMAIAITISKFIEKDIDNYKKLSSVTEYKKGSYDEAYYEKMRKVFKKINDEIDTEFIYTEKKVSDNEVAYILDGEDPTSQEFSPLGSRDSISAAELRVYKDGVPTSTPIVNSKTWGDLITGIAPIKDRGGKVIGLACVDFSTQYVQKTLFNIKMFITAVLFIFIILLYIIVNELLCKYNKKLDTDYLTKLYNRRYYDYYLKKLINLMHNTDKTFSLMIIDIDNFKDINDNLGHLIGDKVLKVVAETIKSSIRNRDTCFRFGGDEFAVILPDTSKKNAALIAERIQRKLSDIEFYNDTENYELLNISLSMGIAEWTQGTDAEKITEYADQALYISKNEGKNKVSYE
jgi:diguanylate cyclase (GGDEF)-like protein